MNKMSMSKKEYDKGFEAGFNFLEVTNESEAYLSGYYDGINEKRNLQHDINIKNIEVCE